MLGCGAPEVLGVDLDDTRRAGDPGVADLALPTEQTHVRTVSIGCAGEDHPRLHRSRGALVTRGCRPVSTTPGSNWPVLSAEVTPTLATDTWTFTVDGLVEQPTTLVVGRDPRVARVHLLGRHPLRHHVVEAGDGLERRVGRHVARRSPGRFPRPRSCSRRSHTGYTTNLPLADVTGGKAWVAWEVDGEPLPRDHGGPARLLVPHLYFWKSAKWVSGLTLLEHDEPGFWERNGYHDRGDPWLEQRYQGD